MSSRGPVQILPQPDTTTCGPTCLHAVYRYHGDDVPLEKVIREVPALATGGTLAVVLACHALRRGYRARIYTYNLQAFDPTWFTTPGVDLADRLKRQGAVKPSRRLHTSTQAYLEFLDLGGEVRFEDLNGPLLRRYLTRGVPILTGLSSTYLYRAMREHGPEDVDDDIRGEPMGHFVVLSRYLQRSRTVEVADPYLDNPVGVGHHYEVRVDRLICSILLGVLTYDANLLIIQPDARRPQGQPHEEPRRRQRP